MNCPADQLSVVRRRNVDVRARSAQTLRTFVRHLGSGVGIYCVPLSHFALWNSQISQVEAEAREMSGDNFTKFMNELNRLILELVNSQHVEEKIGGIMVIGALSASFAMCGPRCCC